MMTTANTSDSIWHFMPYALMTKDRRKTKRRRTKLDLKMQGSLNLILEKLGMIYLSGIVYTYKAIYNSRPSCFELSHKA
jgi:hypothetical protein